MSDLPIGRAPSPTPARRKRCPRVPSTIRPKAPKAPAVTIPQHPPGPTPGIVRVTAENAPQVQAVLLQQVRDWHIRNHRLLREIAYYLRCQAEKRAPTDEEARAFIAGSEKGA